MEEGIALRGIDAMTGRHRPRLICASGIKQGTSSLRYAIKALGWSAIGYCAGGQDIVDRFVAGVVNWDAVFDLPAASMWRELADTYPHAKVIYTPRDTESWLASIEDWLQHYPFKTPAEQSFAKKLYGSATFDRATYEAAKVKHETEVRVWGSRHPDRFMIFDVIGGDGWERLCPFLGVPVPDKPFPRIRPGAPRSTWETAGVKPIGAEEEAWRK